ncbi:hypothetical protein RJ641_025317 [Dillenia turbinata]|uniref:Uncharacterized protein n=1 Tax=Dillenia turbinata TaxID=194707 RepID=A0AAN8W2P1_9MAGN
MPISKDPSTPPPAIGKIGPYTVFITPPSTPKPAETPSSPPQKVASPAPVQRPPQKVVSPPPVQPPPQQFDKLGNSRSSSAFGFVWDAVAKVQNAHSSLDEYVAQWFGLNQSKYQWALDDYYENKDLGKENTKAKEMSNKV